MLKGLLKSVLTEDQEALGLYVEEDEDFLYLFDQDGKRHGVFSAHSATFKAIRDEADKVIKKGE